MRRPRALFVLLVLALPAVAAAHKPSDSYLTLRLDGEPAEGRWDIALRDLEHALGLDADHDGAITWGELRARHEAIAAYALGRLEVTRGAAACAARPLEQLVDRHSDGAYTVLRFALDCPEDAGPWSVGYRLFFDLDPTHRGLLRIADTGAGAVLSPERPTFELAAPGGHGWRTLGEYAREGVWHIWIGFDHVLFLLALLLPAVQRRRGREWQAVERLRPALLEVAAIVTAFTVAHSLTLSAAVLGWVALPSRWVEAAIAATVLLAAANNLRPFLPFRGWVVAFVLGLIHGFGFAGVLVDLGLPGAELAVALFGFNAGVELGQLAIVAAFVPLAFLMRRTWLYRRAVLGAGSFAVAAIAFAWLVERGLGLAFMPF